MGNVKRRRGIGIKVWIIQALQECARKLSTPDKKVSHTTIANKIWRGKLDPIKAKGDGDAERKGISMPEWLWLAIKAYGQKRGEGESHSKVAGKILIGKIPPVPKECMEIGMQQAQLRESEREAHGGKEPPQRTRSKHPDEAVREATKRARETEHEQKRLEREVAKQEKERERKRKKEAHAKEKVDRAAKRKALREEKAQARRRGKKSEAFSKEAIKKAEKDIAKRDAKGAPDLVGASGGPHPSEQEWETLERRAEERVDERGHALSKGEPFKEENKPRNRKINPEDDSFGGVFNM